MPPRPAPKMATLVGASFATDLSVRCCTAWLQDIRGGQPIALPGYHTSAAGLKVREFTLLHGARDRFPELLTFHRFDEIIDHALAEHGSSHVRIGKSSQHDHRNSRIVGPEVGD